MTEYAISKAEIKRRVVAFTTFITSLDIGLVIANIKYFLESFQFSIIALIIFSLALLITRQLIIKFFKTFSKQKVLINNQFIERKTAKATEKYSFAEVEKIGVRKTTRGSIREIELLFANGRKVLFDGLDNFEQFHMDLLVHAGQNIEVHESREHIDYDHPLFYLILGLAVGHVMSVFNIILAMDDASIHITLLIFAFYCFAMGLYFFLAQPMAKRYGQRTKNTDYVFGLILACAGIWVYLATK